MNNYANQPICFYPSYEESYANSLRGSIISTLTATCTSMGSSPMMKRNNIIVASLLAGALIVLSSFVVLLQNGSLPSDRATGTIDTSDWKTFKDKQMRFELKYPSHYYALEQTRFHSPLPTRSSYSFSNELIAAPLELSLQNGVLLTVEIDNSTNQPSTNEIFERLQKRYRLAERSIIADKNGNRYELMKYGDVKVDADDGYVLNAYRLVNPDLSVRISMLALNRSTLDNNEQIFREIVRNFSSMY